MGKEIIELKVDGMDCNNCAMSISRYLERRGLQEVFVNFQTKEVRFRANDQGGIDLDKIKAGIHKLGFTVVEEETVPFFWTLERKLLLAAIFTLPLLAGHLLMMMRTDQGWLALPAVQFVFALPVFVIGIAHFGVSAIKSLRSGVPNMDVLIFVGSTAAFIYSTIGWYLQEPAYYFFETTATIITLVLLGNWLEKRAVAQTTTAIGALTQLQVPMANRWLPSGELLPVGKSDIRLGMLLQVNVGDMIPSDGIIRQGEGLIDESMLTGESTPVPRAEGQEVIGGSTLLSGNLKIEVTATGKNTVLEQMVELVKTAQRDKPPIQQLADQASAVFVPVVLTISLLTFLGSYFFLNLNSGQALMRAIAVLVVSCPCAMGLATPTAVMVGVGRLARLGVLIKGGRTVEQLANIKHLVFDKTGTLTTGKFRIESAEYPSGEIKLANALVWEMERHSSHPIAQSLREALGRFPRNDKIPALEIKEERGIGMVAEGADGHLYRLGSRRLLDEDTQLKYEGDVFLLQDHSVMAVFRLGDEIKAGTADTLEQLHHQGLVTHILSGDQKVKTEQVAQKLGIEQYYAEQLPAAKLAKIRILSAQAPTAMVGDGINDAPALTQADLGISLSTASQVAIQSAKVILLNGRIDVLPQAFGVAEKTVQTIRQNLFWAFAYNIVAIPMAALGFLNPMLGALFMAFSDVVVIGNSIRLKYKKV